MALGPNTINNIIFGPSNLLFGSLDPKGLGQENMGLQAAAIFQAMKQMIQPWGSIFMNNT